MTTDTTIATRLTPGHLVSIKQVQIALSCSRAKAWRLVKDGSLTAVKFGSRMTRFHTEQLLQLMERGA
jgi:excisionase family DNA binding protein